MEARKLAHIRAPDALTEDLGHIISSHSVSQLLKTPVRENLILEV